MNRGCLASSSSAVRSSLMAVRKTESLTNWWPHTSSSSAFVLSSEPRFRTSEHNTANGVGGRATGVPLRSRLAFASSSSNASNRTRIGFGPACESACAARAAIESLPRRRRCQTLHLKPDARRLSSRELSGWPLAAHKSQCYINHTRHRSIGPNVYASKYSARHSAITSAGTPRGKKSK